MNIQCEIFVALSAALTATANMSVTLLLIIFYLTLHALYVSGLDRFLLAYPQDKLKYGPFASQHWLLNL